MALDKQDKEEIVEIINNAAKKIVAEIKKMQVNKPLEDDEKTRSLAIIGDRCLVVEKKLESGELKAADAARYGNEYRVLGKAYKKLLKELS